MALQIRRGTLAELQTITPLEGELIYTTDTEEVYVGDGATQGGILVTASLANLDITSVRVNGVPTTTLQDNSNTGTIIIADGASNYSVRVSTTGTYVTGPFVVNTTATITTLRFADGTTQTTADTANPDQTLNTTSNVRFAGLTVTNIAEFTPTTITLKYNGSNSLVSEGIGQITLGNGSGEVSINAANNTNLNLGAGATHSIRVKENELLLFGKNFTKIIEATTTTTKINYRGQPSLTISDNPGSLTLGDGSIATNISAANDQSMTLGSTANTHNINISSSNIRLNGRNNQEIATFTTSTITLKTGDQQSVLINNTGSMFLGNGLGGTLAAASDATLTLGTPAQHHVGISTTDIRFRNPGATLTFAEFTENTATINTNLVVNGDITANKLTIQYTTVTTTIVETDDIIKTTNSTAAGSGVGAIVATGGISAGSGFYTANTSTFGYATLGPNNSAVSPVNVVADTENMLYFNNNQGGSLIFRQRLSPTTYRNFTINRSGNLVLDTGAYIANGGTNSGGMVISSYFNTSTNVSGDVTINSYANEGIVTVGANGVKLQTYGDAKTIDFEYLTDEATTTLATVSSSTYTVNIPLSATTATITYTNVGTAAQLRSQSSNFPLGESTATIMTIDTAVYSSARLQICVGATLGLDSHTERLTMDILTNGVDVLNAQSGVLSTTSTGICSYSAVLSGTDILVKAELLDPINFLASEVNVLAELVANPMV